ncbi:MAG: LysR family transcriptional regulator, partial [Deferrisomatales bacterium]|nr:LysR family transcriptional regulator [Deferrisomatales bacterium]
MDLSSVNLNLLHSLWALLEEASVSRAAVRLHITQSAVSKQLFQLRELLGDPLLVRAGNRMVPTERGARLKGQLSETLGSVASLLA